MSLFEVTKKKRQCKQRQNRLSKQIFNKKKLLKRKYALNHYKCHIHVDLQTLRTVFLNKIKTK